MRFSTSLAMMAVLLCSGCASYLNPLVSTVRVPAIAGDDGTTMPQLASALTDVNGRIAELEEKRNEVLRTGRVLDLMTFGFGAGAAAYALIPHHTTAVRNLTFSALASYTGATLFGPTDVANVYNSGVTAMACVVNKGAALRSAVIRYRGQTRIDEAKSLPAALVTPAKCTPDPKLRTELGAALSAQDKVQRLLGYVLASDNEEASRAIQAANGVVVAVNREVLKRSNSHEAIFAAAKGLMPRATGTVIQSNNIQVPSSPGRALALCDADSTAKLQEFTRNYQEIERGLTSSVNSMAGLDTSCVLDPVTNVALTITMEKVTVTKDDSYNLNISGGRPPYYLKSVGALSKDIDVQLIQPNTIVVAGKSTISGATGPFDYQVTDNSVVSTPKILKVHTKGSTP